jgi:hypothetical protein
MRGKTKAATKKIKFLSFDGIIINILKENGFK